MDGEYERLDVSKCAARLDTGNEPLVRIKAHGSVLEEATAKKNVVRKRTVKKKRRIKDTMLAAKESEYHD